MINIRKLCVRLAAIAAVSQVYFRHQEALIFFLLIVILMVAWLVISVNLNLIKESLFLRIVKACIKILELNYNYVKLVMYKMAYRGPFIHSSYPVGFVSFSILYIIWLNSVVKNWVGYLVEGAVRIFFYWLCGVKVMYCASLLEGRTTVVILLILLVSYYYL